MEGSRLDHPKIRQVITSLSDEEIQHLLKQQQDQPQQQGLLS